VRLPPWGGGRLRRGGIDRTRSTHWIGAAETPTRPISHSNLPCSHGVLGRVSHPVPRWVEPGHVLAGSPRSSLLRPRSGTAGQIGLGVVLVAAQGGDFTRNRLSGDGPVGDGDAADDGADEEQHRADL